MCTPGRPCSRPPWVTRASQAVGLAVDHLGHGDAVAERDAVADVEVGQQALVVDRGSSWPTARRGSGVRRSCSPCSTGRPSSGMLPARTFGPGRSTMMPIGRPSVGLHPADARGTSRCASSSDAVGQADAGHVHPGLGEVLDHRLGIGGGTDGGDDLRATGHRPSVAAQAVSRRCFARERCVSAVRRRPRAPDRGPIGSTSAAVGSATAPTGPRPRRGGGRRARRAGRGRSGRWWTASRTPDAAERRRAASRPPPCGRSPARQPARPTTQIACGRSQRTAVSSRSTPVAVLRGR